MKKLINSIALILSLICMVSATFVVNAEAGVDTDNCLVDDGAQMFTGEWARGDEYGKICKSAQKIADDYNINFAIVTTTSLDGKYVRDYADDVYDAKFGINTDGIMLLIEYDGDYERNYWISTSGKCIEIFSDNRINSLGSEFTKYFSDDKQGDMNSSAYFDATVEYMENVSFCLEHKSESVATQNDYDNKKFQYYIYALVAALIVTIIVMVCLRAQLKSVRFAAGANNYERPGSMNLTGSNDIFLFTNVTKTPKPKESSSGSSTHMSSSGGSHGGGGGSF